MGKPTFVVVMVGCLFLLVAGAQTSDSMNGVDVTSLEVERVDTAPIHLKEGEMPPKGSRGFGEGGEGVFTVDEQGVRQIVGKGLSLIQISSDSNTLYAFQPGGGFYAIDFHTGKARLIVEKGGGIAFISDSGQYALISPDWEQRGGKHEPVERDWTLVNLTSGERRVLVAGPVRRRDLDFYWQRDDKRFHYWVGNVLHIGNVEDGSVKKVPFANKPEFEVRAQFSPSGKWMLFRRPIGGGKYRVEAGRLSDGKIVVLPVDDSRRPDAALLFLSQFQFGYGFWSPDEESLYLTYGDDPARYDLRNPSQPTRLGSPDDPWRSASISSDGRLIAFQNKAGNLVIADLEQPQKRLVTDVNTASIYGESENINKIFWTYGNRGVRISGIGKDKKRHDIIVLLRAKS